MALSTVSKEYKNIKITYEQHTCTYDTEIYAIIRIKNQHFHLPQMHRLLTRVKSGKFGHRVNSDTHLQTVEIQMRRLLMSRLIRIFTVCLVKLFCIPIIEVWNKQDRCPNLAVCPNILNFTLLLRRNALHFSEFLCVSVFLLLQGAFYPLPVKFI